MCSPNPQVELVMVYSGSTPESAAQSLRSDPKGTSFFLFWGGGGFRGGGFLFWGGGLGAGGGGGFRGGGCVWFSDQLISRNIWLKAPFCISLHHS